MSRSQKHVTVPERFLEHVRSTCQDPRTCHVPGKVPGKVPEQTKVPGNVAGQTKPLTN